MSNKHHPVIRSSSEHDRNIIAAVVGVFGIEFIEDSLKVVYLLFSVLNDS